MQKINSKMPVVANPFLLMNYTVRITHNTSHFDELRALVKCFTTLCSLASKEEGKTEVANDFDVSII